MSWFFFALNGLSIRLLDNILASPDSTFTTMSWNRSLQHLSTCDAERSDYDQIRSTRCAVPICWYSDGTAQLLTDRSWTQIYWQCVNQLKLWIRWNGLGETVDLVKLCEVSVKLWINGSVSVLWPLMYVICNFIVLILNYDTDRRMDTVRVRQTDARWSRNVGILSFESIFSYPFFFSVTFTNIIPYVL